MKAQTIAARSGATQGKHTITFDFKYDGPGFAKGGSGVLKVDSAEVASRQTVKP